MNTTLALFFSRWTARFSSAGAARLRRACKNANICMAGDFARRAASPFPQRLTNPPLEKKKKNMRLTFPHAAAAALFISASSLASAAPAVVVPTFTLDFPHFGIEPPSVVSTDASKTVLTFDAPAEYTHAQAGGSSGNTTGISGNIAITAAEGYRITGLGFSASVTGSFEVGQPPAGATNVRYGDAGNRVWVWFTVDSAQPQLLYTKDYLTAETIDVALAVPGAGTDVAVRMTVDISAWGFGTYFTPIDPEGADKVYGFRQIDLWNPQLTVYTEALPVPEPSTYLMLGAGLALVGARRRLLRRRGQA